MKTFPNLREFQIKKLYCDKGCEVQNIIGSNAVHDKKLGRAKLSPWNSTKFF